MIREGRFEIPGRAKFESVDPNRTRITLSAEMPDSIDPDLISQRMQRSARNIKELMESTCNPPALGPEKRGSTLADRSA